MVTNTVVERRGARVGLLTTRGYRYVLEIARSWTPGPVSGWMVWEKPAPLAQTRDVRELQGRIAADGTELAPHDEDDVRAAVRELKRCGRGGDHGRGRARLRAARRRGADRRVGRG